MAGERTGIIGVVDGVVIDFFFCDYRHGGGAIGRGGAQWVVDVEDGNLAGFQPWHMELELRMALNAPLAGPRVGLGIWIQRAAPLNKGRWSTCPATNHCNQQTSP